jgi:hypothetical protein
LRRLLLGEVGRDDRGALVLREDELELAELHLHRRPPDEERRVLGHARAVCLDEAHARAVRTHARLVATLHPREARRLELRRHPLGDARELVLVDGHRALGAREDGARHERVAGRVPEEPLPAFLGTLDLFEAGRRLPHERLARRLVVRHRDTRPDEREETAHHGGRQETAAHSGSNPNPCHTAVKSLRRAALRARVRPASKEAPVRRIAALVLPLSLLLAACPEKPKPSPESAAADASVGAASASASASASTAAAADAGAPDSRMAHCPSAVDGATTAIKDVEGGVEVSVTAKDDNAGKEIRDRMAKLLDAAKTAQSDAGAAHHDHSGGGHGRFGHCTIVMKGTKLETSDLPNGSKAKVTALDKTEVDWLRRETRDRDRESKAPGGGTGTGSHHMAHCPAAVEGAKVSVKDIKEGVVVTVTGPADKVGDIRDRAKAIADVAKKPEPPKVEHTGTGTGGGGVGKCPIDPEGDDTVDIKEIEGGIEATVKTKRDVAALQKEIHTRAGNFGGK